MPNPDYAEAGMLEKRGGKKAAKSKSGGRGTFTEKSSGFPGVPGKTHPMKNHGVYRCKVYPDSEGL